MDVKINKISDTKREIEVVIKVEEMTTYLEQAAKDFSENMDIKGFRPGLAPIGVVENVAGKDKLWEEAATKAIKETYPKIIEENNLFAVSQPKVEISSSKPEEDVKYKAELYIMPEVKLPDYKKIAKDTLDKEKKEITVEDKEIEAVINNIRESKAKLSKVTREAKKGDSVTINFKGSFKNDNERKIEENDFKVVLGSGELDMFSGFEENILGMKETEKKQFPLEISMSKDKKEVIDFDVEMIAVMERELPQVDDELVSSIPNVENLEKLKEKIKEGIEADKKNKENERMKMKVMENITKKISFEVPEVLIEKEIDNMIDTLKNQVSNSGVSFEDYLSNMKKSEEDIRKEWRKRAEDNVSYAITLYKIALQEDLQVTPEEIEAEVDKHFQMSGKDKNEEKEENLERMRNYVHDVIKNQKVFDLLFLDK